MTSLSNLILLNLEYCLPLYFHYGRKYISLLLTSFSIWFLFTVAWPRIPIKVNKSGFSYRSWQSSQEGIFAERQFTERDFT